MDNPICLDALLLPEDGLLFSTFYGEGLLIFFEAVLENDVPDILWK